MASNSFGQIFKYTSWGESHGKAIGCVIDGVPANIKLEESYIQSFLNSRRPGNSQYTTQRNESDKVEILSGVFQGKTTGAPINLIIYNQDCRSQDYDQLSHSFRPGHADYFYTQKYGIYDYRGGGRASARETAARVAAGAVAHKILGDNIQIKGVIIQIGEHKIKNKDFDWQEIESNPLYCPDKKMLKVWQEYLEKIKKDGDSVGSLIEIHAYNVPLGIGEPVYGKLDAVLAFAIMGINGVKSIEIGAGAYSSSMLGSEYIDEMSIEKDKISFSSNNSGGIVSGISTSAPIIIRFAVKPTSSIKKPVHTISNQKKNTLLSLSGRHDVCIGIRAIPIAKAMMACVLADYLLLNNSMNHQNHNF